MDHFYYLIRDVSPWQIIGEIICGACCLIILPSLFAIAFVAFGGIQ